MVPPLESADNSNFTYSCIVNFNLKLKLLTAHTPFDGLLILGRILASGILELAHIPHNLLPLSMTVKKILCTC